jgi:2-polyprenyl-3-methyl-5-hydroxy-6-metoxy-1,4-benzoquinol methylase
MWADPALWAAGILFSQSTRKLVGLRDDTQPAASVETSMTVREPIKNFYAGHYDASYHKRYLSPFWTRRYTHRAIHAQFLPYLQAGQQVLDVGCGEAVLSSLAAEQGAWMTACDISSPNLRGARRVTAQRYASVTLLQADAEQLPFGDSSFDVVLSSHVLEHLPGVRQGLAELYRVTRNCALIAMPTCLNPAAWMLLGGANYYQLGRRSLLALPLGLARTLKALLTCQEGVDEGYGGAEVPHVWRFPWVVRRLVEETGFHLEQFEAGPLILPLVGEYWPAWRRLQPSIDRLRSRPLVNNLGFGCLAVCRK